MSNQNQRVYIDVPSRPRSPQARIVVTRSTTSPHRSSYRRHSLSLADRDRPTIVSTTTSSSNTTGTTSSSHHTPLLFRDDPSLAGAMASTPRSSLQSTNDSLLRHNLQLKNQLSIKDQTVHELRLRCEQLELDNLDLRRSLDNLNGSSSGAGSDVEGKLLRSKKKSARLELENEGLRARVRELMRSVKDAADERVRLLKAEVRVVTDENKSLAAQARDWRAKCEREERRVEDAERRMGRMRENLDDYMEEVDRLKEDNDRLTKKLERHGLGGNDRRRS